MNSQINSFVPGCLFAPNRQMVSVRLGLSRPLTELSTHPRLWFSFLFPPLLSVMSRWWSKVHFIHTYLNDANISRSHIFFSYGKILVLNFFNLGENVFNSIKDTFNKRPVFIRLPVCDHVWKRHSINTNNELAERVWGQLCRKVCRGPGEQILKSLATSCAGTNSAEISFNLHF